MNEMMIKRYHSEVDYLPSRKTSETWCTFYRSNGLIRLTRTIVDKCSRFSLVSRLNTSRRGGNGTVRGLFS